MQCFKSATDTNAFDFQNDFYTILKMNSALFNEQVQLIAQNAANVYFRNDDDF